MNSITEAKELTAQQIKIAEVAQANGKSVKVQLLLTPRQVVAAKFGRCIAALDYSGQELMLIAALSQDPEMLRTFREPEKMLGPDGKEYPNPFSDMHTLTAKHCCYPDIFLIDDPQNPGRKIEAPTYLWVKIAKDKSLILVKGDARWYAKIVNFGAVYYQSAKSMAEFNNVPVPTSEQWLKLHEKQYPTFYGWRSEMAAIGEGRGWISTWYLGRIRGCMESNSKGSNESPGILAANHCVQGSGSDMTKTAAVRVKQEILSAPFHSPLSTVRMIGQAHDELVYDGPGRVYLDLEKSKWKGDVISEAVWVPEDPELLEAWVGPIRKIMVDTETEILGGILTGRVGESIAPYWSK